MFSVDDTSISEKRFRSSEAWQSVTAVGEAYEAWLSERREQQSNVEMTDALFRRTLG
jgi:hypothetical protein